MHIQHSQDLLVLTLVDECRVKMEIDVPISVAYSCYSDREAIPQWMPFISTVKVCNNIYPLALRRDLSLLIMLRFPLTSDTVFTQSL